MAAYKGFENKWWRWQESNLRPPECKSGALPAELHPLAGLKFQIWNPKFQRKLVAGTGFEPATFGLWAQRATGLLHPASKLYRWWAWVDSNYRPHAYQACALTNWATGPQVVSQSLIVGKANLKLHSANQRIKTSNSVDYLKTEYAWTILKLSW